MPKYEVFIPAALASEFNVTLKVDADNWMAALKTGLKQLGEHGTQVVNILVDIQEDNSIHVTDSSSGRVFRIQELAEAAVAPAPPAAQPVPVAPKPVEARPPSPSPAWEASTEKYEVAPKPVAKIEPKPVEKVEPKPVESRPASPAAVAQTEKYSTRRPAAEPAAPKTPAKPAHPVPEAGKERRAEPRLETASEPAPERRRGAERRAEPRPESPGRRKAELNEPRFVERMEAPSRPATGPIGRAKAAAAQLEEVYSDLFERTQELVEQPRDDALEFLLDLALEKIPADAGSVFVGDLATASLKVASARGPKSEELKELDLELPMGVGVVGFCAQEAVGLAISDTEKDPRFYREVSEKLGYPTRSIICAPMVSGGRSYGCIEIINKRGTSHFTDAELSILAYVAHQGAKYLERVS